LPIRATTDLSQRPEVYELIQQEVVRVNRSLLEDEVSGVPRSASSSSCTRSWTPTTRRSPAPARCGGGYVAQKYAALIEALYGDRDRVSVEAQVTYEDGRKGPIRADVTIR
jgi:long-chain acyl-CoA synthetase